VALCGGDRLAGIRCAFVGHGDYRGDGLDSQAPRRLGELACRCRRADSALGAAIVVHDGLSAFVLRRVFDRDVCAAAAEADSKTGCNPIRYCRQSYGRGGRVLRFGL